MIRRVLLVVALTGCVGRGDTHDTVKTDTVAPAAVSSVPDSASQRPDSAPAAADTQVMMPSGRLLTPWDGMLDSADSARSWFVLRERQSITELIPTRASVVVGIRPCNDTDAVVRPTGVSGPWIAMFSEVPGLRAGAIEAARLLEDPMRVIAGNDSTAFTFREQRFVIRSDSVANGGFRIFLDGAQRLTLVEPQQQEGGSWDVLWAGDLNRDGAPDILLQTSGPEGVRYVRLFMSGAVPKNGVAAPIAMAAHHGC